jgi:hypothetical protein
MMDPHGTAAAVPVDGPAPAAATAPASDPDELDEDALDDVAGGLARAWLGDDT